MMTQVNQELRNYVSQSSSGVANHQDSAGSHSRPLLQITVGRDKPGGAIVYECTVPFYIEPDWTDYNDENFCIDTSRDHLCDVLDMEETQCSSITTFERVNTVYAKITSTRLPPEMVRHILSFLGSADFIYLSCETLFDGDPRSEQVALALNPSLNACNLDLSDECIVRPIKSGGDAGTMTGEKWVKTVTVFCEGQVIDGYLASQAQSEGDYTCTARVDIFLHELGEPEDFGWPKPVGTHPIANAAPAAMFTTDYFVMLQHTRPQRVDVITEQGAHAVLFATSLDMAEEYASRTDRPEGPNPEGVGLVATGGNTKKRQDSKTVVEKQKKKEDAQHACGVRGCSNSAHKEAGGDGDVCKKHIRFNTCGCGLRIDPKYSECYRCHSKHTATCKECKKKYDTAIDTGCPSCGRRQAHLLNAQLDSEVANQVEAVKSRKEDRETNLGEDPLPFAETSDGEDTDMDEAQHQHEVIQAFLSRVPDETKLRKRVESTKQQVQKCAMKECNEFAVDSDVCPKHANALRALEAVYDFTTQTTQTSTCTTEDNVGYHEEATFRQYHYQERCVDILDHFPGFSKRETVQELINAFTISNSTLVIEHDNERIYSQVVHGDGIKLKYDSSTKKAHLLLLKHLGSSAKETRNARPTVIHVGSDIVDLHRSRAIVALRNVFSTIVHYISKADRALDALVSRAVQGLSAMPTAFKQFAQRTNHRTFAITTLGATTGTAITTTVLLTTLRKLTAVSSILQWLQHRTPHRAYLRRYAAATIAVMLYMCWMAAKRSSVETPEVLNDVLLPIGVKSSLILHSGECAQIQGYHQCTCGSNNASIAKYTSFLNSRINTDVPESMVATHLAYSRLKEKEKMEVRASETRELAANLGRIIIRDAVLLVSKRLFPCVDWGHLRPTGCDRCGVEGRTCVHQSKVCLCGMSMVSLGKRKFCGLCDTTNGAPPGETNHASVKDVQLVRHIVAGSAVPVQDKAVPVPTFSIPSRVCVKDIDAPQHEEGPVITHVDYPLEDNRRTGTQVTGIFFHHVPYNSNSDTTTKVAAIQGRQARKTFVCNEKSMKQFVDFVDRNHEFILNQWSAAKIPRIPDEDWEKRFPGPRRKQIQEDRKHYQMFGLSEADMSRKSFIKNELVCKSGFDNAIKHAEEVQALLERIGKMVPVFDGDDFSHQFRCSAPASFRKKYRSLDRNEQWFYNPDRRSVLALRTIMHIHRSHTNGCLSNSAARNITSYRTFKPSLIVGPHFVPWLDRLKRKCNVHHFAHVTSGKNQLQLGEWFEECRRLGFNHFSDGDAVKYDSCMDTPHFEVLHSLYRHVAHNVSKDFWRVVENMKKHMATMFGGEWGGLRWQQTDNSSRGSGDNDTTLGNTLIAIMLHAWSLSNWLARYLKIDLHAALHLLPMYFRFCCVGDDATFASRLPPNQFRINQIEQFYNELGFEYELHEREDMFAVSFMGSSPFPVVVNGVERIALLPELDRLLPKIGCTANINQQPLKWCKSVALGWERVLRAHPLYRPIIDKYLELGFAQRVKAFECQPELRYKPMTDATLEPSPHAIQALRSKYGLGGEFVDRYTKLVGSVKTLPTMILMPELRSVF